LDAALKGRWPMRKHRRIFSAPKPVVFLLAAATTAALGVAAPIVITKITDNVSSTVDVHAEENGQDHTRILPYALDTGNTSASDEEVRRLVSAIPSGDAVTADKQDVRLIVQGHHSRTVTITNISARVTKKTAALDGTLLYGLPQGELKSTPLGVELSRHGLSTRDFSGPGKLGPEHFRNSVHTLTNGEVGSFQLTAHAHAGYFEWVIDVDLVTDGRRERVTAQGPNGPFRLTSLSPSYDRIVDLLLETGDLTPTSEQLCRRSPTTCTDTPW
jgi:hypothetical protein